MQSRGTPACSEGQAALKIDRTVKIPRSAQPVIRTVMELDAELELVLTPRIRNVVVYGLGLLVHQLVSNRCARAQAGKALRAPGNTHNRKATHRRRRTRAGNETKLGIVRLAYLRGAFRVEIHQGVA